MRVKIVGFFRLFGHSNVTKISLASLLDLSLRNFNYIVHSSLFPLYLSYNCCHNCHLINTIASIRNFCTDYLPNASHEQIVMIIIYNLTPCTEIYLHIVMTNYLKRSQPLFNDTYLNALISSFHHFFFLQRFI